MKVMMKKEIFIYDLETYVNMFLAVFKKTGVDEWYRFEISDRKNEINELRAFLKTHVRGLIGFNNVNFDYPVLHKGVLMHKKIVDAKYIYNIVEDVIQSKYSSIYANKVKIPQLDLFRIWHYNNKNKSTSLKWLEFAMRMKSIEDLPYKVGSILTHEQMDHIIEYCDNDIIATEAFYNKSLKHIQIREFYTGLEGINLMNSSEIEMSKEIFGKYLAKEMGISKRELTNLRTQRDSFPVSDVIFDYIKFNDPNNADILTKYNESIWRDTSEMTKDEAKKHSIKFSQKYKNVTREYAEGGLHSFGESGIYESNDEYVLVDVDFKSYYPHISFRNNLHPEHIPEKIFSEIYEGFYTDRTKYPKSDPRNYVLKIILNGSYGLSKDKYSFLYDPKWQMAICINGQLMLTMLTERVFENCEKDVQIIFENTDGAMYKIHRSDYERLEAACKEVEEIVDIPLEIQKCDKIIAKDVNNYINCIDDNNIKYKGCFEIDRDYHKNHSKRIVSLALGNHYINGISVETSILNYLRQPTINLVKEWDYDKEQPIYYEQHGLYDFCIGSKMKGANKLFKRYIKGFEIIDEPLNKTNRYVISNIGSELIKKLPPLEKNKMVATDKHRDAVDAGQTNIFDLIEDVAVDPKDRETNLEVGWKCNLLNDYKVIDDINYDYYINECNKIINVIK